MNPVLHPIFARRSVRKYTAEPVSAEQVRDLLEAAMAAPSACATDPWHFVVVRERAALDAAAGVLPNGQMLRHAPLGILVVGDRQRAHRGVESYMLQDCCAATQNLLLAASMLGLGAVWLGVHPNEDRMADLAKLLTLPATAVPVAMMAIGHPAETPPPRTRYREAAVHAEAWS
jgi:nitroreductase